MYDLNRQMEKLVEGMTGATIVRPKEKEAKVEYRDESLVINAFDAIKSDGTKMKVVFVRNDVSGQYEVGMLADGIGKYTENYRLSIPKGVFNSFGWTVYVYTKRKEV